jgi:peptide-methionine (R)-S-oxide reductase
MNISAIRNTSLALVGLAIVAAVLAQGPTVSGASPKRKDKVVLSDAEWKKKLTPQQYDILRHEGTEPAFRGQYHDNHKAGTYFCVGCGNEVFRSDAKFDSGTGWPSFFQPAKKDAVWIRKDTRFGMVREEVLCSKCDGHLGHVFDDGPADKTGLRYCINGIVLKFKPSR